MTARAWSRTSCRWRSSATPPGAPAGADGAGDLLRIATPRFPYEALPSIGSGRSGHSIGRGESARPAHLILVEGGDVLPGSSPAALAGLHGARVECVAVLRHAGAAEIHEVRARRRRWRSPTRSSVRRWPYAEVAFSLDIDGRRALRLPALVACGVGAGPAIARLVRHPRRQLRRHRSGDRSRLAMRVRLVGRACLTFNRGNNLGPYLFVRGPAGALPCSVRARLNGAPHADFLGPRPPPGGRAKLELDPTLVDVNVHPARRPRCVRDPSLVRGLDRRRGFEARARRFLGHRALLTTVAADALGRYPARAINDGP